MFFKIISLTLVFLLIHFIKGIVNEQTDDATQVHKKDNYNVYVYSGPNCKGTSNHSRELSDLKQEIKALQKDYKDIKAHQDTLLKAMSSLHSAFIEHKERQKNAILDVISSLNDAYVEQKKAYLEHKNQQAAILDAVTSLKKAAYLEENNEDGPVMEALSSLTIALVGGGGRIHHMQSPSGAYKYTRIEAKLRCEQEGMALATMAQLQAAYSRGLHSCRCGWLKDGMAAYPIQWPRDGCGGDSTESGIRTCTSTSSSRYDAYCFK